ncbi:MAG: energy transducer TonB [Bacteroidetes bacterium]|nr:energy transducer TonB [Bacteroidota bacterium]
MNTTSKMFSDWSEVTSGERNEIVFERLNKTYGAYEIRTHYDNTLAKAFSATILLIGLLTVVFFIAREIPKTEIKIPDSGKVILFPPLKDNSIVPKQIEQPLQRSTPSTDRFKPVVDDSHIDNTPLPKNPINNFTGSGNPLDTGKGEPLNLFPGGEAKKIIDDTATYWSTAVQEQARFPGGEEELFRFLKNNAHTPQVLIETGNIKEKIGVAFTVDKDGGIINISLQNKSRYNELNEEALRVVKKMPAWEPARQNGEPVKERLVLPIRFEVK